MTSDSTHKDDENTGKPDPSEAGAESVEEGKAAMAAADDAVIDKNPK